MSQQLKLKEIPAYQQQVIDDSFWLGSCSEEVKATNLPKNEYLHAIILKRLIRAFFFTRESETRIINIKQIDKIDQI